MRTKERRDHRALALVQRVGVVVALVPLLAGCGSNELAVRHHLTGSIDDLVSWADSIDLEETRAVLNVHPVAAEDPRGGFVVADRREAQVRLYTADGRPRSSFGKRGNGPGEFRSLAGAVRLSTGDVLALDQDGRAAVFDSIGASLLHTATSPFGPVQAIHPLDGHRALIVAPMRGERLGHQLHVWNAMPDSVVRSFFMPSILTSTRDVVHMAAWAAADVRGDTIAVAFSVVDSIHIYTIDGSAVRTIPLPSADFRRMSPPVEDLSADPKAPLRWLASFDVISAVSWTTIGTLLVQYQTMDESGNFFYRLVNMTSTGKWLAGATDTPRMMMVGKENSLVYFVHPNSETPNRWAIGRIGSF